MDIALILKLIAAATELAKGAAPLIAQAGQVFGTNDEAKVRAALAELQEVNDALQDRVQAKLRG